MRQVLSRVGMVLLLPIFMGCIKERKQAAGEGFARLTVRNLGGVVGLLNADTTCGFSSDAVKSAATIVGNPGEDGSVTFTVTDCTINAGSAVDTDCNNNTTTSTGSFTATATLTITGLLTGDTETPVVPGTADSVTFDLQNVVFDNFKVVASNNDNSLTNVSGSISATISPRFAVQADANGEATACAVPTKNVTFTDVVYSSDSVVLIETPDKVKEVEIGGSNFSAQNGVGADGSENSISGTMVVLGLEVDVTGDGALDPEYDAATFISNFDCDPELLQPVSFTCPDVRQNLAFGSARLSALTFGVAAGLARAQCPFVPAGLTGNVGDDDSVLTLALAADCNLTFPAGTVVSTDCNGDTITVSGAFTVSAGSTLDVTGYNVGNAAVGVLPTSRRPALVTADISFNEFSISKSVAPVTFTVHSGDLSGALQPRFFLDQLTGACTVTSPILGTAPVTFEAITWTDADVTLDNDGSPFNFTLNTSSINAQSGDEVAATNEINGSITFSGNNIVIPAGTDLEEGFSQQVFDDAFQSCAAGIPDTAIGVADAACSFRQVLGNATARLMVGSAAASVSAANALCGAATSTVLTGANFQPSTAVATTTTCPLVIPAAAPGTTDCVGSVVDIDGSVTASAVTTTSGIGVDANADGNIDTVVPNTLGAISGDTIVLDFSAFTFDKQAGGVTVARLTTTGDVTVENFSPVLAQSDANSDGTGDTVGGVIPLFNKTTPIFSVTNLDLTAGTAVLVIRNAAGLLTFNIELADVSLDAFVGASAGVSDDISGTISVDGEPVTLNPNFSFPGQFSQAALDASYSCVNTDADVTNGLILVTP
jgi:hypothetical protein